MADATPSPLPAGSQLVQDLGCLACTLPQVEVRMPTQTPHGEERTRAQHVAHQGWHQRRLRIAQGHSSVQCCRLVTDRIHLWKAGVRIWEWHAAVPCTPSGCA